MSSSLGKRIRILNKYEFTLPIYKVYQVVSAQDIKVYTNNCNDFLMVDWDLNNKKVWYGFKNFCKSNKKKIKDLYDPEI